VAGLRAAVRTLAIRAWYEYVNVLDREFQMTLMNYGLEDGQAVQLDPADEDKRYRLQLYRRVAGTVDLSRRDVLEVGSGRGGGAAYVVRTMRPASFVGLDSSRRAISFCRRQYAEPGLAFVHGDAARLGFPDASFDVVLNIESSHCYPEFEPFLEEVRRVLRPGGHLLFADFRFETPVEDLERAFERARLAVIERRDITEPVLRALELDSERKGRLIDRRIPRIVRPHFRYFAGLRGTRLYDAFRTGSARYWLFALSPCR
jgi:SAM-dependent methyltransferase